MPCRWISSSTTLLPIQPTTGTQLCKTPSAREYPLGGSLPIQPPTSAPSPHMAHPALTAGLPPVPSSLESLLKINYNAMDGLIDRQSFHGLYAVQDGLPL